MAPSVPSLVLALLGAKVVVSVTGGKRFEGILVGATGEPDVSVAIRNAVLLDGGSAPPVATLLVLARDLLQLDALEVSLRPTERAFRTDTAITGAPAVRAKPLEVWAGQGEALGGLEERPSDRKWDQFAANARLTDARSDYHEDLYTTALDRNTPDYRQREQRAARLEREILQGDHALASNAHMAEERNGVDDSGLDEEDRYGAVIRNDNAYVPPGARKSTLARLVPTPSPPASVASVASSTASKLSSVLPGRAGNAPVSTPRTSQADPPVVNNFRQFVSDEKERLAQKKQGILKLAERKEQDSRLASLLEFSQNFKLKGPVPADLVDIIGNKDAKKSEAARAPAVAKAPVRVTASLSTLIAEIPPFNPARNKAKLAAAAAAVTAPAPASTVVAPAAPVAAKPLEATAPTTKLKVNPNAPAFVFRPGASSFTPSFAPAAPVASPSRKAAELPPANQFFGNSPIKRGSSSMHVKEDFTPFKNGVIPEPSSILPAFAFTGRPYRSTYPASPTPPPPLDEDGNIAAMAQGPQGYPMYPPQFPPNYRFQPQHPQMQMPPQGNPQFHYPPPMPPYPQYGNPQQQQRGLAFGQFPPTNGPPLGFDGRLQ